MTERQAFLALNALPNIGPITLNRLLAEGGGDPRAALEGKLAGGGAGTAGARRAKVGRTLASWREHFDLAREEERLARSGADFLTVRDPAYPGPLREIHDPPVVLYRKGGYDFALPCVAIVGSRRPTLYGREVARRLAGELARAGFCVASGLARGIDTAAHEGALGAGGRTVAVLGTGLDVIYPPENLDLYRRISESGAVVSEFPFGRRADRQSFAMRNRIVSGLSSAVVVVESDVAGGAMITARFAGEQGRPLFAVPGRIDQPTSAGCHQLIRDGATLLTGAVDLLSELSYLGGRVPAPIPPKSPGAAPGGATAGPPLTEEAAAVLGRFSGGAVLAADTLAEQTGLPAAAVAGALVLLELKRLVGRRPDGSYEAGPA